MSCIYGVCVGLSVEDDDFNRSHGTSTAHMRPRQALDGSEDDVVSIDIPVLHSEHEEQDGSTPTM